MPLTRLPALELRGLDLRGNALAAQRIENSRTRNALAGRASDRADEQLGLNQNQNALAGRRVDLEERRFESSNALATAARDRTRQVNALAPNVLNAPAGSPERRTALGELARLDPKAARDIQQFAQTADENKRAAALEKTEAMARPLAAFLNLPTDRRAGAYPSLIREAQRQGLDTSGFPEQFGQEAETFLQLQAMKALSIGELLKRALPSQSPGGFSLSPGQTRFDAGGQPIASIPAAPGGGISLAQQRENSEIDEARRVLAERNLSPDDIRRLSQSATNTGRANNEFEEFLKGVVLKATSRKTGDDPEFENVYSKFLGGRDQSSSLDDLAGQPDAKGIQRMSVVQLNDLANGPDAANLSPADLQAIDSRLTALGF